MMRTIPDNIRRGRRALEGIEGIKIIRDVCWLESASLWILHCALTIKNPSLNADVGDVTEWFIQIPDSYPFGTLDILPGTNNSLKFTHQHQAHNTLVEQQNQRWRQGSLCLRYVEEGLGWQTNDSSLFDAGKKLLRTLQRAIAWLEQASQNRLVSQGDPFELPPIPAPSSNSKIIIFQEDKRIYEAWTNGGLKFGAVACAAESATARRFFVRGFGPLVGRTQIESSYGTLINDYSLGAANVCWILLDAVPVLKYWHIPTAMEDLLEVIFRTGGATDALRKILSRGKDNRRFLLLGFPVPERIGELNSQIHWLAIQLIPKKTSETWDSYVKRVGALPVKWIPTENWSAERLRARGAITEKLATKRVLVIGAGSVGSLMAEILVRSGVSDIIIIDKDSLSVGNLSRHTLELNNLGQDKARAIAQRLNRSFPMARASAVVEDVTQSSKLVRDIICKTDLIIDATGSDAVAWWLSTVDFDREMEIASVSLGYGAKRCFTYLCRRQKFDIQDFSDKLKIWISQERSEYSIADLPWEYVGCWNPVFPARYDSISSHCAFAVRTIDAFVAGDQTSHFQVAEIDSHGLRISGESDG